MTIICMFLIGTEEMYCFVGHNDIRLLAFTLKFSCNVFDQRNL